MMENLSFHLESIVKEKDSMQDFEGPLSLILMLLQKNKIEIKDLRVSDILDQYLAYLEEMQSLDLEISSEFVQMASHLLYLKTRELLTVEEEVSELDLLRQSLEQLQAKDRFAALRTVIPWMKVASEKGFQYLTKAPEPVHPEKLQYDYRHQPIELLRAMLAVWTRDSGSGPVLEERFFAAVPRRVVFSLREKSLELISVLRVGSKPLSWFYRICRSDSELVATFVAILELCGSGSLKLEKNDEEYVLSLSGDEEMIESALNTIEDEE